MREIIGNKISNLKSNLPKKLIIKEQEVTSENLITSNLNKFFANIGINLASKIEASTIKFNHFLPFREFSSIDITNLNDAEIENAFSSLKRNKRNGYGGISANIILDTKTELFVPLKHILQQSLGTGNFPDQLKVAKIIPVFKKGELTNMGNY